MTEPTNSLVERLFARHRDALQSFFHRRLRSKSDAADLAQEVYVRMLRVPDPDGIRNPEAYLYTVAANLLKESATAERRRGIGSSVEEADDAELVASLRAVEEQVDVDRRIERLREVLKQLPPKCCAAVVLQYRYGLSYQEIAERLEVSPHMVKKYLGQALGHCRRRMARMG
jgi:RNA polymerase sigma-70 factor (ECF subfamily)